MAYAGGKDAPGVWQRVINQVTPHDVFVSAFAGDCAVSRHIRHARSMVLIDKDASVISSWESRRWEGLRLVCGDAIIWLQVTFRLKSRIPGIPTAPGHAAMKGGASSLPTWRPGAADVFRDMVPELDSGLIDKVGVRPPPPRVFVYLDPPYLLSTRTKKRIYDHELSTDDHHQLLVLVRQLPCHVLIHGYPSNLYSQMLSDWRSFTFLAQTRGGQRTEQVWCNYPDPVELHDYAHVGENRRVRERINRRRRNWYAALKRVGPHERGAILQALLPLFTKQ